MKTPVMVLFVLVVSVFGDALARSLDHDDSVVAVLSGSFYALEEFSGETSHRLSRRHLDSMNGPRAQAMRLDLGPEVAALDMELSQDSAWTDDSLVVVRRGEQTEEIRNAVDRKCFLSGRLRSHAGAATINRCGRLSGMIQTNDFHYEIQEAEGDDLESEFSNVKVIMRRSEEENAEHGYAMLNDGLSGREKDEADFYRDGPTKRQYNNITAEVAAFLDSNFANWMSYNRYKTTTMELTQWIIFKWNAIRSVYANADQIGIPFALELKRVEVWWQNPDYYDRLTPMQTTDDYLVSFCGNSTDDPNSYDHLMLYTQGTGSSEMGMAYLNGICRSGAKCSLVKSKTDSVKYELHEFGHNVGLDHDPDSSMQPCNDPSGDGGFMGWGSNYNILDCYRRVLLEKIKEPGAQCLYETNVNFTAMNPVLNSQMKFRNRKKQRQYRFRGRNY